MSDYLRGVPRGGQVVVLDRDTLVALIVPHSPSGRGLTSRPPNAGATRPGAVALPPPLNLERDIVDLVLAERQGER